MKTVTARKIREHGTMSARSTSRGERVYQGVLVNYPTVGHGLVIFRDESGNRMVTTPVRRILNSSDSRVLYVETDNSVYRLTFEPSAQAA